MLKDKDLREPLFEFLEMTYGKVRIIEEKQMGKSRADIVMVTERALFGIEIKSDADTYDRLKRQVKDYNRFFEYNYVAIGTKHAAHIEEHVPDWWGIITLEEGAISPVDCYILRKPKRNPKCSKNSEYCLEKQLEFLWRNELLNLQNTYGLSKYSGKSKRFIRDKLLATVPAHELGTAICNELFERDYTVYEKKEQRLPFTVVYSSRKTVCVEINQNLEMIVRAPKRMKEEDILRFVEENRVLIQKNYDKMKEKVDKYRKELDAFEPLGTEDLKKLAKEAKKVIPGKVEAYANLLGVRYGRIAIRNQSTRWGSCSSLGNLNFNCLLVLAPEEIVDYVVAHEVCHLKHMNHSREFWSLVETLDPDYRKHRKWLKDHGSVLMGRVQK